MCLHIFAVYFGEHLFCSFLKFGKYVFLSNLKNYQYIFEIQFSFSLDNFIKRLCTLVSKVYSFEKYRKFEYLKSVPFEK